MPARLHGLRYLDSENEGLATFIREDLHYLDFNTTRAFYAAMIEAGMRDNDIALLGCNDRFFLLTAILGRKDAVHQWLFDRCREVEEAPDGFLDLWAREHYKSTIITFAGIIQEVMRDPEITISIFSFNKGSATEFLKQIKYEFDYNDDLRTVYADVLWKKPKTEAPQWSLGKGITVRRKSNPKEATIECSGLVDGMPIGKHYRLMIYDDIVTEKFALNPEMVQKAMLAWENSDNLGAGNDVRKWHIGTRYSFADPYGIIMERAAVRPRIYTATDNNKLDGKPVFISVARWEEKKRNQRQTVSAQMLQNPIAGRENLFIPTWFKKWEIRPSIMNVYIMCDPSLGQGGKSDRTAIAVVGMDPAGNKYLLDGFRHRMSLSDRWEKLRLLWKKWNGMKGVQNVFVGYERYGMQSDLEVLREKMRLEDCYFDIRELNWPNSGSHSKKARVGRLEPDFRGGKFYLPATVYALDATFGHLSKDGKTYIGHPKAGQPWKGECLWRFDEEQNRMFKTPMPNRTGEMARLTTAGLGYRVATPIRRIDEDGRPYDVTWALIEEMTTFPFSPHDDMVDVVSRIYDMEPIAPNGIDERQSMRDDPVFEDA